MPVSIRVSDDAAGAERACEEIRGAIRRAGQEGREFSKLDLSHPELKKLEADIRKVQQGRRGSYDSSTPARTP